MFTEHSEIAFDNQKTVELVRATYSANLSSTGDRQVIELTGGKLLMLIELKLQLLTQSAT